MKRLTSGTSETGWTAGLLHRTQHRRHTDKDKRESTSMWTDTVCVRSTYEYWVVKLQYTTQNSYICECACCKILNKQYSCISQYKSICCKTKLYSKLQVLKTLSEAYSDKHLCVSMSRRATNPICWKPHSWYEKLTQFQANNSNHELKWWKFKFRSRWATFLWHCSTNKAKATCIITELGVKGSQCINRGMGKGKSGCLYLGWTAVRPGTVKLWCWRQTDQQSGSYGAWTAVKPALLQPWELQRHKTHGEWSKNTKTSGEQALRKIQVIIHLKIRI